MNAEGQIDPAFAQMWLKLLRRPNVLAILAIPDLTIGRKIAKILCTLAADEYGELEFKWYEETKKVRDLEKELGHGEERVRDLEKQLKDVRFHFM
jgi:septal ring factor EnvC (AmiA/AmiB activator)